MLPASRAPIPVVVEQHAEESAILRNTRSFLIRASHVQLHRLRRIDDRIAAHLDGLAVAGEYGANLSMAALETPGVGEVFAAAVRAIEDKDAQRLDRLFAVVEAVPEAQAGLTSAFGWVSSQYLQGTVSQLLSSPSSFRRRVGIAACAMHGVDAGPALEAALKDTDPGLRACALRALGQLGRRDLQAQVLGTLADTDVGCRFWAAWSAALLDDREKALDVLMRFSLAHGPYRERAMQVLLKVMDLPHANEMLKLFARDPKNIRVLIQSVGIVGDPLYVPWLIKQMGDAKLTRLAGESFSFITGLDLAYLDLEVKPPEGLETGPTDDPTDEDVSLDADDDLPWPDAEKIREWWETNRARFQDGTRYFMGETVNPAHCLHVLKEGCQRQRIAAALYLCLLQPGTVLFNCAAPAWRQKRWLDKMV
jgi:uncharacterized protein (TIGR02270 family)